MLAILVRPPEAYEYQTRRCQHHRPTFFQKAGVSYSFDGTGAENNKAGKYRQQCPHEQNLKSACVLDAHRIKSCKTQTAQYGYRLEMPREHLLFHYQLDENRYAHNGKCAFQCQ